MIFNHPLRSLLVDVECVEIWSLNDWDILYQQAYASGMMASIYAVLKKAEKLDCVPQNIYWHLESANTAFESHIDATHKEVKHIFQALSLMDVSLTFLKGTAYCLADDQAHKGRIFNDVDIFVPKDKLATVEQLLAWNGWSNTEKDEYDESYYRDWMHELPPLTHHARGTTLDVHHNLLPIIGRVKLDANKLLSRLQPVDGTDYQVLSPEDRILHSASHLFLNGEFDSGFRDLYDLHQLLSQHSLNNSEFYTVLVERSQELGLERVLRDCFYYTKRIFGTAIPVKSLELVNSQQNWLGLRSLRDEIFIRALQPRHKYCEDKWTAACLLILFLRGHWLKMPLHILLYHSVKKSFKGLRKTLIDKDKNSSPDP